jgi:hypothetical protein
MQEGAHAVMLLLLAAFGPTTPVDAAGTPPAAIQDRAAPLVRSSSSIGRGKPSGDESPRQTPIELPPREHK